MPEVPLDAGTRLERDAGSGQRVTWVALPPESGMLRFPILAGRGLQAGDTNAVVLNASLAAAVPGVRVDSEITLRTDSGDSLWRVVGIVRERLPTSPPTAYVPLPFVEKTEGLRGQTNSLRITRRDDTASVRDVQDQVDRALEQAGIDARPSSSNLDERYALDQHVLMVYVFLVIVASFIAAVGAMGLATTLVLNVVERQKEFAVLRTIGAPPRTIGLIVAAEGFCIAALSWLVSALASWPLSILLGRALVSPLILGGPDFSAEPGGLLIALGASIVLASAACVLPVWRSSRLTVREAMSGIQP